MVDLKFQMNFGSGFVDIDPPRNWTEMKVQLIFDNPELQLQLQSINFEWVSSNAQKIKQYYDNGILGGTGILEGIGLKIFGLLPGFGPVEFFSGCINTADDGFSIQNDFITCPIKESGKTDYFNDQAKSFSFEYLTSLAPGTPGYISRSDYKQVPYAISSIPDYTQAMLLSISLFIIIKESVDCVAKIASLVTRAISQSLSWLQLIGTIVEIVLYLIYMVAIITASAKLIQQIADNIVQPKKTKLGMREVDLFIKGAAHLGLNFVSPIYGYGTADLYEGKYANMTIIPKKIKIPDGDPALEVFSRPSDETTNPESYGYYEGTFFEFKTAMESVYNAICIVKNGTLYFQEKNSFNIADAYRLPNEGVVGNTFLYPQPFGTNASEIPAVYRIRFQKDDQDLNTYNDYKGTFVMAQATPLVVTEPKNQLLSGSVLVDLPFALARRKVGYTKLEKMLLDILASYADFINSIGDSTDEINNKLSSWMPTIVSNENVGLSNAQVGFVVGTLFSFNPAYGIGSLILGSDGLPIIPTVSIPVIGNDRIGWMLLSSDFIGVQKRFAGTPNGDDWYIDANNTEGTFISANPALSGTFTGTITGLSAIFGVGGQAFTGTIVGGLLTGTSTGLIPGAAIGIVTGTIAGIPGTFSASVSGFTTGLGVFSGSGVITASIGAGGTIVTQGWGGALALWNDFHYTNGIAENQWLTFKNKTFKFGVQDFIQVNDSNILVTPDGLAGKFQKLIWTLYNDKIEDVDYRLKYKYTTNYNLKITTDGG